MELKTIYIELGKFIVVMVGLYLPAMMIESDVNFMNWSNYTRFGVALLFIYSNVLLYDTKFNEKTYKYLSKKATKLKTVIVRDWNKLRKWH